MTETQRFPKSPHKQRKTILIVEDDQAIGTFLVEILNEEQTYQALLSTNGLQAFECLKTLTPDLFLLDYRLPGMNGLEIADHLRALDPFKQIPILLLSAYAPPQELLKRQIPFLAKPFELDTLLQMIETLLNAGGQEANAP